MYRRSLITVVAVLSAACGASSYESNGPRSNGEVPVASPEELAPLAPVGFQASVTGTVNTSVTWSVVEVGGGTIDATGQYVAPGGTGTFHVVATSVADPSVSAAAIVTVTAAPPPPANGAPMTTASRTAGVAPLSVFFDAVDTVPAPPASPFAWSSGVYQPADGDYEGLTYVWDFGDGSAGNWSTNGLSRNTATGYTAAHVYESPGTYTASLTITDKAGATYTYVQAITVSAFSGTTYYVAANGSDSNNGLSEAAPFLTASKGFSMAGTNRRVLFRRGDSFSMTSANVSAAGPGIIGAYGSGNRPVLNSSGGISVSASDWRVMDLQISGPGGSTTSWGAILSTTVPTKNVLFLRLNSTGWYVGLGWTDYGSVLANPHDGATLMECETTNISTNGVYLGGRRLALLGNDIHDITSSHVLRVWEGHKAVISSNRLWNPGPTRHALKLHGPTQGGTRPESRWVTISDNLVRGKIWSVAIGPQDTINNEPVSHVVYERNRHYGESSVQVDVLVEARQVMVRNNVLDGTGASSGYTGVAVWLRGIEPPARDVRVLNNTILRNDAASSFYGLSVQPVTENVTFRNNLLSAPSTSSKGVVTGTPGAGFVNDHNLLTATPGFTDPAVGNFSLQASSPAVDAGVDLPDVGLDFAEVRRQVGAAYDLGAFESH